MNIATIILMKLVRMVLAPAHTFAIFMKLVGDAINGASPIYAAIALLMILGLVNYMNSTKKFLAFMILAWLLGSWAGLVDPSALSAVMRFEDIVIGLLLWKYIVFKPVLEEKEPQFEQIETPEWLQWLYIVALPIAGGMLWAWFGDPMWFIILSVLAGIIWLINRIM